MKNALFVCLTIVSICAVARAEAFIAAEGKSDYRIVLPQNAIASERYAAEQLQHYLEQISGARLAIISDDQPVDPHEVLLGDNRHLQELQSRLDLKPLGPDGFVLKGVGGRLIIAGGRPRGTLNGVYTLLEEHFGVRWFTPELEVVPKRERLELPAVDRRVVPALENRDVFWREMMRDADFAAKHRLNGQHYSLKEKHGGAFTTYYPFVHSLDMLVPRGLYKEHPEYFPLINGKRKDGYVQRCLSNPEVLKIAIAAVRRWITEHPDANIISVSQNDTIENCQCDRCKAIDDAEGSPAGSLLKFVNAIAEDIERDHPNIRLDTLAYQYTRKPPKTIRPRHNVIIRLCSIECCFAHPLETCSSEANRRFREDIVAWQPVAPRLYVWDYTPNFGHYQQPFPNFDSLQANVRFFVNHGVKSVFEQGNYSGGGQGEMGPVRAYLLAKLLWDPNTELQKHKTEFLHAYFGKASEQIQAYLELEASQVRGKECHAHVFDSSRVCYLNESFLTEADRLLDSAEQVAENEIVRRRVQIAHLPVWYVKLATNRVTGQTRSALVQRFLSVARQAHISNISEGISLEDWAKKMNSALRP